METFVVVAALWSGLGCNGLVGVSPHELDPGAVVPPDGDVEAGPLDDAPGVATAPADDAAGPDVGAALAPTADTGAPLGQAPPPDARMDAAPDVSPAPDAGAAPDATTTSTADAAADASAKGDSGTMSPCAGDAGNDPSCKSSNTCTTKNGGCDVNAVCHSTGPGTNSCTCSSGYSGDGKSCTPINACATKNGGCSAALPCVSTGPGTRSCLTVADIRAGDAFNCVRMSDGTLRCWGLNQGGELANTGGNSPVPVVINGKSGKPLTGVARLATGSFFVCANETSGALTCWGDNRSGQLGDGTTNTTAVPVTALSGGVRAVALGFAHSCIVVDPGVVECWGSNANGQLGDGSMMGEPYPTVAIASGGVSVAASLYNSCAVTTGGALHCWGSNAYGQIGDGTATDRPSPIRVISSGVTAVTSGASYTCAIVAGSAMCWGRNGSGQLGDGTKTDVSTPETIIKSQVVDISATAADFNPSHTCAVLSTGAVQCWGSNTYGQLGDGTATDSTTPVTAIASGAAAVRCGTRHTCALMQDGTVRCWGDNQYGATAGASPSTPVVIAQ